jgi:hypothetical protein
MVHSWRRSLAPNRKPFKTGNAQERGERKPSIQHPANGAAIRSTPRKSPPKLPSFKKTTASPHCKDFSKRAACGGCARKIGNQSHLPVHSDLAE